MNVTVAVDTSAQQASNYDVRAGSEDPQISKYLQMLFKMHPLTFRVQNLLGDILYRSLTVHFVAQPAFWCSLDILVWLVMLRQWR